MKAKLFDLRDQTEGGPMKSLKAGCAAVLILCFVASGSQVKAATVSYSGLIQAAGMTSVNFNGSDVNFTGNLASVSFTSFLSPVPTLIGSGSSSGLSGFTSVGAGMTFTAEWCLSSGCGAVAPINGGVDVHAFGLATPGPDIGNNLNSLANATFRFALGNFFLINVSASPNGQTAGSINVNQHLSLQTNTVYSVTMTINAASSQTGSWSAMIDPMFDYDQSQYSLILSPGVVNGDPAATPLPAAFPLFATGLAGLGWITRRKRKHAAV